MTFQLVTVNKNLTSNVHSAPPNHLKALNQTFLWNELWQPPKQVAADLGRKYNGEDILDMLDDLRHKGNSTVLKMKRDPKDIVDFSNKSMIPKDDEFYWRNEDETEEVINIIAQKGIVQYLSLTTKEGQNSLRLCTNDMKMCFKARIVMITEDFPGFRFSAF